MSGVRVLNPVPMTRKKTQQSELELTQEEIDKRKKEQKLKRKISNIDNELETFKKKRKMTESNLHIEDQIKLLNVDMETKLFLLDKNNSLERAHGSDYSKGKTWLKTVLNIPFGKYKPFPVKANDSPEKINEYFKKVRGHLDAKVHNMDYVKDEIMEYLARKITNPRSKGHVLALCGPAGVGKTKILKSLGDALDLPFYQINFGGMNDASILTGHSETYVGSKPGKLVEFLQNSGCMNPVIYLDECFPYTQLIETNNGLMSIGKLYNDFKLNKQVPKIKSFNEKLNVFEYKNISNVWEKENDKLLKLQFQNLTTTCTENHLFLTERGYIKAKDILIENDKIISQPSRGNFSEYEYEYMFLKNKEYLPLKKHKVYDIEIEDNHNFVIVSSTNNNRSGIVVHNCDKIASNKERDINGILTHLLDEEQNSKFQDNYLSNVPIDLSKVFFVIAFNDFEKVDHIVSDRLKVIYITSPTIDDKMNIAKDKMIPDIIESFNFKKDKYINLDNELLSYIINNKVPKEEGVRQLRKCLEKIFSKLNYYILTGEYENHTKYFKVTIEYQNNQSNITINIKRAFIDKCLESKEDNMSHIMMYV